MTLLVNNLPVSIRIEARPRARLLLFLELITLVVTATSFVNPARAATQYSLAPTYFVFDYAEFTESNETLNREQGDIYGIDLAVDRQLNADWRARGSVRVLDGRVDYDGETQLGLPHETATAQRLTRIHLRLDRTLDTPRRTWHLFAGVADWGWHRDIRPRNNVSRLREKYDWLEFELGAGWRFAETRHGLWLVELSHLSIQAARVTVNLDEFGFGRPRLRLAEDQGNRLALAWRSPVRDAREWGVRLIYESWEFGASDSQTISNGVTLASIREPDSESEHVALQLSLTLHAR